MINKRIVELLKISPTYRALRGRGLGKILVNHVLEKLIEEDYDKDYRLIAKYPFVVHVVSKSEKLREIVEH